MLKKILFLIALILNPLIGQSDQAPLLHEISSHNIYRPSTALYWQGPADSHNFHLNNSHSTHFPPFDWNNKSFTEGEAWYEFDIPDDKIPQELAGILITRVYLTADVYLNKRLIGSGGSMEAPLAKNAHRPLYFTIPQSAWQTENNKIRIHHKSYPEMGYIVDVLVGADKILNPIYQQRYLQQQSIPKVLFIIEILSALFLFYIWLSQRHESSYLWFSCSMLMISIFTLNQFLINTHISHKVWLTLNNTSIDWWAIALIIFVNKKLEINKNIFEYSLFAYAFVALCYYISLPLNRLPGTTLFHALSMFAILMNIFYIAAKANKKQSLPYIIFFTSLLAMALHDILMQSGVWISRWLNGHFILFYAAPLACFLVFGKIIREFVSAMQESKRHAVNLEMHINLTKQELELQYEKLQRIAESKAIENERERIYRDLHDDVGAKLLALFYRSKDIHLESLAKSALEDLRDIVSRKSLDGELLKNAVVQWENEAKERITEQGIQLSWENTNISNHYKLNESQYTHVKRMLREAISNALRHNKQAEHIHISISLLQNNLSIAITNDGVEKEVNEWQHGRGINNMTFRARELGGALSIFSKEIHSATLLWTIPISKL